MIKIIEFIQTGLIQEIQYGLTREELLEKMGPCECTSRRFKKDKQPSIYKYGIIEFYFGEPFVGGLQGIIIQPNINPCREGLIKFDYGWIDNSLVYSKIIKQLKNLNVQFNLEEVSITTNNNVSFLFYEESQLTQQKLKLCKIGRFI